MTRVWKITPGKNSHNSNVTMSQEQFGQLISAVTAQHQFHDVYFGMNSNDYKRFKVLQHKGRNRSEQEKKEFKALQNKHNHMKAKNKKGGGKRGRKRGYKLETFKNTFTQMLNAYQKIEKGEGAPENTNMEATYSYIKSKVNDKTWVPVDDTFALDKLLIRSLAKKRGLPESVKNMVRTYTTKNPEELHNEYEAHIGEFVFLLLVLLSVEKLVSTEEVQDYEKDPNGDLKITKNITRRTYKYQFIQTCYKMATSLLQVFLNTDEFVLTTKKYERDNAVQNADIDSFDTMASNTYKNRKTGTLHKTYYFKNGGSTYSKKVVWPGILRQKAEDDSIKEQILHFVFFLPARQNKKFEEQWVTIESNVEKIEKMTLDGIKMSMNTTQMYLDNYTKTGAIAWSWKFEDQTFNWSDIPNDQMKEFQWKLLPKKKYKNRKAISVSDSKSLDTLLKVINVEKAHLTLQSMIDYALPRECFDAEKLSLELTRTDSVTMPLPSVRRSLLSWD